MGYGYQKTHNFMLIPNLLKWAQSKVQEKSYRQKLSELGVVVFSDFAVFTMFLLMTFLWEIILGSFQKISNRHKILCFLIPHTAIFMGKNFSVLLVLVLQIFYAYCTCSKNGTFSKILQEVKSYFLQISITIS
jgi:hypothetical protein